MRVHSPTVTENGAEVVVSARVEVANARTRMPESLWFAFPHHYRDWVTGDLNGFATALLPLAMTLDEDLMLEGRLSPRLRRGLSDYTRVQSTWRPTAFHRVAIEAEVPEASCLAVTRGVVASSFSAGIDSCYTLWRHLPERAAESDFQVTHCLMINGFDADSDTAAEARFGRIRQTVEPVLAELGVELIVCRTNYLSFSDPNILKQSFGAMVTAPALVLGGALRTFLVPASYRFDEFFRDGSHLLLDHLVATESMETVHDASHLNRPDKTRTLAAWSPTYSMLRVCSGATASGPDGASFLNCGRCEKCVRTMKTLQMWGALHHYSTFAREPGHLDVWRCFYGDRGARLHAFEIMRAARAERRFGLWLDYAVAVGLSWLVKWPRGVLQRLHLALEERSEAYARGVRRLFPRLRKRAYWIRSSARHVDRPEPTMEAGRRRR